MEDQHVEPYKFSEDHCIELSEEEYAQVTIKALNQDSILKIPRKWTGLELKCYLMKNHPCQPKLMTMKIVISAKELRDHDLLDAILKKDWKESSITVYILDESMKMPTPEEKNSKIEKAMNALADHDRDKIKEKKEKKKEEEKKKTYKKLKIPKSLFVTQHMIFFIIFIFMIWSNTSFNVVFWIVMGSLPYYYFEVKKNINEFYDKKLRELNIPYETESQKEIRIREEIVKKRIEDNSKSERWDEETLEKKYSLIEIVSGLVYYFFASFFPGYIDRQLDIFQREHDLLESKKKLRDRRREFERKKREQEEKIRKEQEENKQNKQNVKNTYPHQPSLGDDPLEAQDFDS